MFSRGLDTSDTERPKIPTKTWDAWRRAQVCLDLMEALGARPVAHDIVYDSEEDLEHNNDAYAKGFKITELAPVKDIRKETPVEAADDEARAAADKEARAAADKDDEEKWAKARHWASAQRTKIKYNEKLEAIFRDFFESKRRIEKVVALNLGARDDLDGIAMRRHAIFSEFVEVVIDESIKQDLKVRASRSREPDYIRQNLGLVIKYQDSDGEEFNGTHRYVRQIPGMNYLRNKLLKTGVRVEFWKDLNVLPQIDAHTLVVCLSCENPWRQILGRALKEDMEKGFPLPPVVICIDVDKQLKRDLPSLALKEVLQSDRYNRHPLFQYEPCVNRDHKLEPVFGTIDAYVQVSPPAESSKPIRIRDICQSPTPGPSA